MEGRGVQAKFRYHGHLARENSVTRPSWLGNNQSETRNVIPSNPQNPRNLWFQRDKINDPSCPSGASWLIKRKNLVFSPFFGTIFPLNSRNKW